MIGLTETEKIKDFISFFYLESLGLRMLSGAYVEFDIHSIKERKDGIIFVEGLLVSGISGNLHSQESRDLIHVVLERTKTIDGYKIKKVVED